MCGGVLTHFGLFDEIVVSVVFGKHKTDVCKRSPTNTNRLLVVPVRNNRVAVSVPSNVRENGNKTDGCEENGVRRRGEEKKEKGRR